MSKTSRPCCAKRLAEVCGRQQQTHRSAKEVRYERFLRQRERYSAFATLGARNRPSQSSARWRAALVCSSTDPPAVHRRKTIANITRIDQVRRFRFFREIESDLRGRDFETRFGFNAWPISNQCSFGLTDADFACKPEYAADRRAAFNSVVETHKHLPRLLDCRSQPTATTFPAVAVRRQSLIARETARRLKSAVVTLIAAAVETSIAAGALVAGVDSVLPLARERPHAASPTAATTSNNSRAISFKFLCESIVLPIF